MKKHYYIIFAVILLIASVSIGFYINMGGFAKSTSTLLDTPARVLIAQHYKGSVKNKAFAVCFSTAADLIKSGGVKGQLAAYYVNNPDKGDGTADAFVGILLPDTAIVTLPKGFERVLIPARQVIHTEIKAHFSMASKIYNDAKKFAKNHQLRVYEVEVLEIYPSEKEFVLETPIIKK
ncbi:MAG: hypothetical protein RL711_55 [Bacteroidota bacterium]